MESKNDSSRVVMRLRAHHICCAPFWTGAQGSRGPRFQQAEDTVRSMFLSPTNSKVMVVEGADDLCQYCPLCIDGRCASPQGEEEEVRKWDTILLKELGVPFNSSLTCRQWHDLVEQKVPLKICRRCLWRKECTVGSRLP